MLSGEGGTLDMAISLFNVALNLKASRSETKKNEKSTVLGRAPQRN